MKTKLINNLKEETAQHPNQIEITEEKMKIMMK